MASVPITSWQIEGEEVQTVTDFIFLGSKITVDGDCSHEIKRCLLLGRKSMTNLGSVLKSKDITLPKKVHLVKAIGEGNGNPLQYSCLENPRDSGAYWAAVCGVAQSWTRLMRLSSSSSQINENAEKKKKSSTAPQFKRISSSVLSFLYSPTLTSLYDYWKAIALTRPLLVK